MWLTDFVKGFFKPTKTRIFLFIMVFVLICLYDIGFKPFPNSPIVYSPFGKAPGYFVAYFLVMPYVLSCLIPSVLELRRGKRHPRHARLWEFLRQSPNLNNEDITRNAKPATKIQSTYILEGFGRTKEDVMEMEMENLEEVVESSVEREKKDDAELSYVEKIEQSESKSENRKASARTKPAVKSKRVKRRRVGKNRKTLNAKAKKPKPKGKRK